MGERLNPPVCETGVPDEGTGGSNPPLSAQKNPWFLSGILFFRQYSSVAGDHARNPSTGNGLKSEAGNPLLSASYRNLGETLGFLKPDDLLRFCIFSVSKRNKIQSVLVG